MSLPARRIWLCADDYGLSAGVNRGIRQLIADGRLSATSVMAVAPGLHRSEATALSLLLDAGHYAALGLHVTLTGPFRPLTDGFSPLREGTFLPLGAMLGRASLRRLKPDALRAEIASQLRMFIHTFDRAPDFVDGHQHVHIFPQVREAFLDVVREMAPHAWVRQCGRTSKLSARIHDRKGLLLDILSLRFRQLAEARGVQTNPAFAGTYAYDGKTSLEALFPQFLEGLPDGGLIMCHPGFVDAELQRLDPLTLVREEEYAFLSGDSFPRILREQNVTLA